MQKGLNYSLGCMGLENLVCTVKYFGEEDG